MIHMLRRLYNSYRNRDLVRWRAPDDNPEFVDAVARERKRGATIGKRVRLLGTIDGVNPHLVSVGDYCVIGGRSALLAHCPIKVGHPADSETLCILPLGPWCCRV